MKTCKSLFWGIVIVFTFFSLLSCTSTSNSQRSTTSTKSQQDKHWDLANNYRRNGKYVLAVAEMERIVKIDPKYRLLSSFHYSPSQAAPWGIRTNENISFGNFSIYAMMAFMYFDMAGTGSDPEKYVPQADRQATFEKALSAYRKAYEIDITNGGNNNRNLQTIYLAGIALTLDRLGRTNEANTYYTQLSRIANVTDPIARRIVIPLTPMVTGTNFQMNGTTLVKYNGSAARVTIPAGVTVIGSEAFRNNRSLTSVTIPSSVTSIEYSAFEECTGLTSVSIPASVTSISDWAFAGCTGLTSVTIPSSVTSIGMAAFSGCTGLTSITIPSSVTSIGEGAFNRCTGLTSIIIPSSVTSIGRSAFEYCSSLTNVTIPSSVRTIGEVAFYECRNLRTATVSRRTRIGADAFPSTTRIIYSD